MLFTSPSVLLSFIELGFAPEKENINSTNNNTSQMQSRLSPASILPIFNASCGMSSRQSIKTILIVSANPKLMIIVPFFVYTSGMPIKRGGVKKGATETI